MLTHRRDPVRRIVCLTEEPTETTGTVERVQAAACQSVPGEASATAAAQRTRIFIKDYGDFRWLKPC